MTSEQAIEIITNCVQTEKMTPEQDLALAIVQKLAGKDKARKILCKKDDMVLCPTCRTIAIEYEFDEYNFCPYCGQRFAKSEEQE